MTKCQLLHLLWSSSAICFQSSSPRFIAILDCVATFLWETEAACPIKETKDDSQVRKENVNRICSINAQMFFSNTPGCCVQMTLEDN